MSNFGKELIESAHEALAIAEGRANPARAVVTTIPFSKLSQAWKQNPEFVAEYERIGSGLELTFALSEARRKKGGDHDQARTKAISHVAKDNGLGG